MSTSPARVAWGHMSQPLRVGILGLGPAGVAHGRGYAQAGGYRIESVCDLIASRAQAFQKEFPTARVAESLDVLLKDPGIDVVSVCLPTDLHASVAVRALKSGKHVVMETPLGPDLKSARAMLRTAEKAREKVEANRPAAVLLPAYARHYGAHEMAARQAVSKGYIGTPVSARVTWLRPRGVPQGVRTATETAGWYTDAARSGGGALIDLGGPMLELGWSLLGCPVPTAVFATGQSPLTRLAVEESASALVRFEGGQSLEVTVAWAGQLPPQQYGVACRVSGEQGCVDVYTPTGPVLYRGEPGKAKATPLKGPKVTHHAAMMRHLKSLISGREDEPLGPARRGVAVAAMIDAAYRSLSAGKSCEVRAVD